MSLVVIVGATGGLGSAFARTFAGQGANVLLAARDPAALDALAAEIGPAAQTCRVDITDPASLDALCDRALATRERVEAVVNATGVDVRKLFTEHTASDITRPLDVNLMGAILLTRAFLPHLLQPGDGVIVHMGGFGDGRLAFPYYSVDVATRAGLFSFIESVNRELEGSGVVVTYFCPNPADTDAERPYHPIWREMGMRIAAPAEVAEALVDAVRNRRRVYIMGGLGTVLFAKLNAVWPRLADALLLRRYGRILKRFLESPSSGGQTG